MSSSPARIVRSAALFVAIWGGVSCSAVPQLAPLPTTPPSTTTPPPATATADPRPVDTPTSAGLRERPLAELSEMVVRYMEGRPGPIAVAVVIPDRGVIYSANGDALFYAASIVKVPIMLTLMERAIREGRGLTMDEQTLLELMITESENDPAELLWRKLDDGAEVESYLHSLGLAAFDAGDTGHWAGSRATANELARLMALVAGDKILDGPSRARALDLMGRVVDSQRWGITAGAPSGSQVALKNGWFIFELLDITWWVNSAGVVFPARDRPVYSLAILTDQQNYMREGIETIERIAVLIHAALLERYPAPATTP